MRSVLAAAAVLTSLLAPAAHAATVSSLSVYSDADDFIGDGVPRVAYPGGPAVSARPDTFSGAGLALGAITGEEGVGVELAPPPGEALRRHNWTSTHRARSRGCGRCSTITARAAARRRSARSAGAPRYRSRQRT